MQSNASDILYKDLEIGEYEKSSFKPIEIKNDNISVSLIDKTYDGKYMLLRIYENQGKKGKAEIYLENCKHAYIANMNEEIISSLEVKDGYITIDVQPHKIITVLWN